MNLPPFQKPCSCKLRSESTTLRKCLSLYLIGQEGHVKIHDIIWIRKFHLAPRVLFQSTLEIFLHSSLRGRYNFPATGSNWRTTICCCCLLILLLLILNSQGNYNNRIYGMKQLSCFNLSRLSILNNLVWLLQLASATSHTKCLLNNCEDGALIL